MRINEAPIPFVGELMVCCLCGREQRSDPTVSSQWRCVQLAGRTFYACPDEFPPDDASAAKFMLAYKRFIAEAVRRAKERQL